MVVLQTHMDMVCEKNTGVDHDFDKDPIQLARDTSKNWMIPSKKTTLGADDGLGMSHALLLATDPKVIHGPLELLFTVGEEIG
jgi:dipeptidase D